MAYGGAYGLDLSSGGGIPADLDALFDQTKSLAATPRTITELPGGLTNRNYKVTTPDGTFVARISSGGSELLAIDRDCEYRNSVTAAAAGAGAPVVEYRPHDRRLVIGYIEGRTFDAADVTSEENLPRIAAACRRLHAGVGTVVGLEQGRRAAADATGREEHVDTVGVQAELLLERDHERR